MAALLATLVLISRSRPQHHEQDDPRCVDRRAESCPVYFNSSLTYGLMRLFKVLRGAGARALIGASNFFELAVGDRESLVRTGSGAALATVGGVLIEVPVMLSAARRAPDAALVPRGRPLPESAAHQGARPRARRDAGRDASAAGAQPDRVTSRGPVPGSRRGISRARSTACPPSGLRRASRHDAPADGQAHPHPLVTPAPWPSCAIVPGDRLRLQPPK